MNKLMRTILSPKLLVAIIAATSFMITPAVSHPGEKGDKKKSEMMMKKDMSQADKEAWKAKKKAMKEKCMADPEACKAKKEARKEAWKKKCAADPEACKAYKEKKKMHKMKMKDHKDHMEMKDHMKEKGKKEMDD